jgi:hypothetical protein
MQQRGHARLKRVGAGVLRARLQVIAAVLASAFCCPRSVRACVVGPCETCKFEPYRIHGYLIRPRNGRAHYSCGEIDLLIVGPSGTWQGLLRDFTAIHPQWGIQLDGAHAYWTAVAWNTGHTRSWGEVRSLRLGSAETRVLYRGSAWQLSGISLARDGRSMLIQHGERAFSLLKLPSAEARALPWPDLGPRPREYHGEVRMLGWSSDSQSVWFVAECRRYFRARAASATAQLIREFEQPTGCSAFNPDQGLGLHVRDDVLWLTDMFSGRSLPVASADSWYLPHWTRHDGFTYSSGGRVRHVANAQVLRRWSVFALWTWALGCGGSALLAAACQCRRRLRIAIGLSAATLGCCVFCPQLLELYAALLGPIGLLRESSASVILHNQLSASVFFVLLTAALRLAAAQAHFSAL